MRSKREAITPTKVEPIETTLAPENGFNDISNPGIGDSNLYLDDSLLQGSIEPCAQWVGGVTTVTVTETVTLVTKS